MIHNWKHLAATWFAVGTLFGVILAFAACSRDEEPTPAQEPTTVHYAGWEQQ